MAVSCAGIFFRAPTHEMIKIKYTKMALSGKHASQKNITFQETKAERKQHVVHRQGEQVI